MTFSVGENVSWSSQAQGFTKRKDGVVVAYVPPGNRPCRNSFPDLYKGPGVGFGRSVDSYVVRVGNKHYWPITKNLSRTGANEFEQAQQRIRQLTEQRAALLEVLRYARRFLNADDHDTAYVDAAIAIAQGDAA